MEDSRSTIEDLKLGQGEQRWSFLCGEPMTDASLAQVENATNVKKSPIGRLK